MTVHIGAKPGDIAETVLMPAPTGAYRAKWAAETFEGAELVNEVRGMLGFTGTWRGNLGVTIQGSGMGMPSLSIYANELMTEYGAQTLIRIGSCGGMQSHVGIRDVIIAMTASTITSPSSGIFRELNYAPCADYGQQLSAAVAAAEKLEAKTHVTRDHSSMFSMRSAYPISMSRWCAMASSVSRWKRRSITRWPRGTSGVLWRC